MRNFTWRLTLVGAVLVIAIVLMVPSINLLAAKDKKHTIWPHKVINLGLDLQGGMHLELEVQAEDAVASTMERHSQELREELSKSDIDYCKLEPADNHQISLNIKNRESFDKFEIMLKEEFPTLKHTSQDQDGQDVVYLALRNSEKEDIMEMAVRQVLETIRNRIDQFGVSEPDIRRQGKRGILVQLPGVTDTNRARDLLVTTAQLQFKLVIDDSRIVKKAEKGRPPPGIEVLKGKKIQGSAAEPRSYVLKKRPLLTGECLTDAHISMDQYGVPYVAMEFDKKGGHMFARITKKYVNKQLAIVLDNVVHSAPEIQEEIRGGRASINGRFTIEEAKDLAIVLRAGAMPASVKIPHEETVGPSLGHDSISKGLMSMAIGGLLVVLFMVIYYKGAGLIADFALILNVVLIGAGLAAFGATLTLPGIAGIILTIGMAVDANVLIFERIREEGRLGKTPTAAVDAGFAKATLTILDANVTTLVAALVLFAFGTGPIKGFAVTLSLGIVASLFTAIVLSRVIFDYFLFYRRVKALSL